MTRITNFIGGEFVEAASGQWLDNIDPAVGRVYSQVCDSDAADVDRAVLAAEAAFDTWSNTPAAQRSRIMLAIADLVERDLDRLARAECVDNGKPLALARALDIPRAAANFRFFGSTIQHVRSECFPMDGGGLNYTLRKPLGVAGIISPWNLPLYLFTWKVAPAIAAGNTVVAKPSEVTPMTAFLFCALCKEAGLPDGVLNVVHGLGAKAGAALVRHPQVPMISFTGGTATGRDIAATASPLFKKISLELGGKNPNVIFADADMEAVIEGSIRSSFANQGQVCLSGSRMLVERSAFDAVRDRLVDGARKLTVGDPLEAGTDQGAMVSKAQHDKVISYIDLARRDDGYIRCGGGVPDRLPERCKNGYFILPTVITDLPPDCRVNQEEIFGPVVTLTPFDSEDEAVALANCTEYGLCASVWTRDVSRAHRVAERIQSGTVWVNSWMVRDLRVPFGGMKASGVGREGGDESLRFFTEPKNVYVSVPRA